MKKIILLNCVLLLTSVLLSQTNGGPDLFGYTWYNSDDANGPDYEWLEHTNPTEVTGLTDDNHVGPFPIGFLLSFYDVNYTEFYIQSNGVITFDDIGIPLSNRMIPEADAYNNLIAWFWDDLDPVGSTIYYENIIHNDQTVLLISFINYYEHPDGGDYVDAQMILFPNGDIKINYQYFSPGFDMDSSTVGIENAFGTDGLLYVYNQDMFDNEMSLMFYHPAPLDNDLAVLGISGPIGLAEGTESIFQITVKNRGVITQDNYTVKLFLEGDIELSSVPGTAIELGEEINFDLPWTPDFTGNTYVYGFVEFTEDEDPLNNQTDSLIVQVFVPDTNIILTSNFSTFPPEGWSTEGGTNWGYGIENNAGGQPPEARFHWSPNTTGVQRLMTPPMNTLGALVVNLEFKHMIHDYNGDYVIRLETSSDGETWNIAHIFNSQGIPPTVEYMTITTADVGSESFQLAWVFDGYSHNINDWYIDDVIVMAHLEIFDNDLAARNITGPEVVNSGSSGVFEITVKNVGNYNIENYTVKLMRDDEIEIASEDISQTLIPLEERTHSFVWNIHIDEQPGYTNLYGKVMMTGDENILNDNTQPLEVRILEAGAYEVTIGDGIVLDNKAPLSFNYNNSLSQTLYYPEEIGQTGIIQSITYYSDFVDDLNNKPAKIWIGETELLNFNSGWNPTAELILVFDGNINYPNGQNAITINFAEPYVYEGGNLVIMAQRPWDDNVYDAENKFFTDTTADHPNRMIYNRDNTEEYDPLNPPEQYFVYDGFPNTTFLMMLTGLGRIEGYVYDEDNVVLPGAMVANQDSSIFTYTNDEGFFQFANVPIGEQEFTASLFGYSPQTLAVEVLEDETVQLDFNLIQLGTVSVTGIVTGSDFPDTGLEGAIVSLTIPGLVNYQTVTNADGEFTFPEVYPNYTYDLSASHDDYETYSGEAIIENEDFDLGTLILYEMTSPPDYLQAVQNESQTSVDLNWNTPGFGIGEFRYDDGEYVFNIGLGDTPPNGVFGAVHPHQAILTGATWYLTSDNGAHYQVNIIIFGLDGNGDPDQEDVLYESGLVPSTDNEWSSFDFPVSIEAPNGFLVGINTPNQYTSIGYDDGVGAPWEFQENTQMMITDWTDTNENWIDLGISPFFNNNLMIRAYGIDLGEIDRRIDPVDNTEKQESAADRELESYNVYRFAEEDQDNPEEWDLVAASLVDTFYTDDTWTGLDQGFYQFAVTSIHTNNIESEPVFSPVLEKTITGVDDETIPLITYLTGNFPNPFNPITRINYQLSKPAKVELVIFNLKGQKIKQLISNSANQLSAGQHSVVWDGKDDSGRSVSSGVYFYKLQAGDYQKTRKMILLR
ncbi:MAG TPA: T9SS type A sorting domain-containing protein [Candidatus Cloacimonetes bacterium]|nr:T9SS type A sorting domain-containing protein [Candidatus Cloacimonadota bacterium]